MSSGQEEATGPTKQPTQSEPSSQPPPPPLPVASSLSGCGGCAKSLNATNDMDIDSAPLDEVSSFAIEPMEGVEFDCEDALEADNHGQSEANLVECAWKTANQGGCVIEAANQCGDASEADAQCQPISEPANHIESAPETGNEDGRAIEAANQCGDASEADAQCQPISEPANHIESAPETGNQDGRAIEAANQCGDASEADNQCQPISEAANHIESASQTANQGGSTGAAASSEAESEGGSANHGEVACEAASESESAVGSVVNGESVNNAITNADSTIGAAKEYAAAGHAASPCEGSLAETNKNDAALEYNSGATDKDYDCSIVAANNFENTAATFNQKEDTFAPVANHRDDTLATFNQGEVANAGNLNLVDNHIENNMNESTDIFAGQSESYFSTANQSKDSAPAINHCSDSVVAPDPNLDVEASGTNEVTIAIEIAVAPGKMDTASKGVDDTVLAQSVDIDATSKATGAVLIVKCTAEAAPNHGESVAIAHPSSDTSAIDAVSSESTPAIGKSEAAADQEIGAVALMPSASSPLSADIVKTEAANQSAEFDVDNNDESEAARQAASWIEDASEAASTLDASAASTNRSAVETAADVAVPKLEPMTLLEAKMEPMEVGADQVHMTSDRKATGINGSLASPTSQPCSSSASGQSSQLPTGGCKTLESALTKRQRHDLELIGSCPRCEKFREQVILDENNEPQPGFNILPDYLADGLDMVVIGINPSITSAYVGHHYAGPGNHFWSCISESGLIAQALTCHEDHRIVEFGIGFTNVCTRPTKGAAELTRKEMKEGAEILLAKLKRHKPKIAVFNGKGIYEAFVGNKNFYMGKQPEPLLGTDIVLFVMPSSSARCAQLPRAADKLPFYVALRKLRDYVVGLSSHLNDADVVFTDYTEMRVTQPDPKSVRKAERRRKRKAELAAAAEKNAAAAAAADEAKEAAPAVPAKLAALQQPQAAGSSAAAAAALLRNVKVEATAPGGAGTLVGQQPAAAAAPQYALLTQQPGQFEWQIYQPTLYYQLANPGDQGGAGGATAAAAAAYLRPQLQILPESAAGQLTDGQSLGFANLVLLDPSQLAAAAATTTGASNLALMPSSMGAASAAAASGERQSQQQQQLQQLTYTTL